MDRSHVSGILPNRLEQYMKEAEQDLKVTEINLRDKMFTRSSLGAKWCRYSFEEQRYKKTILNQVDKLREEIRQRIYDQKKNAITSNNPAAEKLINLDTERALVSDPLYKKLKEALVVQEDIIRLIKEIQKQISMMSYDLNNVNSLMKLENI